MDSLDIETQPLATSETEKDHVDSSPEPTTSVEGTTSPTTLDDVTAPVEETTVLKTSDSAAATPAADSVPLEDAAETPAETAAPSVPDVVQAAPAASESVTIEPDGEDDGKDGLETIVLKTEPLASLEPAKAAPSVPVPSAPTDPQLEAQSAQSLEQPEEQPSVVTGATAEVEGKDGSQKSAPSNFPAAKDMPTKAYLEATVVPLLRQGLRDLVKVRPADPYAWLAEYFITNKPETWPQ